jgi:predicted nucleotidyltransferase
MKLRTHLMRWALRLYWPPFTWLYRFYYWLAIQLSRSLISRVPSVRSIYLTGSWVRQDAIYSLSDIDFKVLVAGRKDQDTYQSIRRRFSLLRRFFPMLGPPDEKGIYFLDSFESDYRHYPLVQHLFDSRFFRHRKIWGEDLLAVLPVKPWIELDQDECTFGRLRDWTERIHLLADFDGLAPPQIQHLFFKAVSDVALLAIRSENPEAVFSRRAEILQHVCPEMEEPYSGLIENLILENRVLYRRQLNSADDNFRLFKRMVSHCCEKIARKDMSDRFPIRIEPQATLRGDANNAIGDALKGFSSKIRRVSIIRWPQLPLNPFDLIFFNTTAYLVECSGPLPLNEFHQLKAYCRANFKQRVQVLLREDAYFLSAVDTILVDHWGSYSGSSDLMNRLLGAAPIDALTSGERSRIKKRTLAFREQLADALSHPELGRMDLAVFPPFLFNALRMLIFDNEFNKGRWEWHVTPDETVDFLLKQTPLKGEFPRRLAGQYQAAMRDGVQFDERLLLKSRALLAEMMEICSNNGAWDSLEKLNSMPDEQHLAISVAIATSDRPVQLERCLQSIARLNTPPLELIIVDNNGNSSARHVVRKFQAGYPIHYFCCSKPGVAPARNMAARAAQGEIIAFVDDDACVTPDWLEHLERVFLRDPQIGLASGVSLNMQCGREDRVWKFMEAVEKI